MELHARQVWLPGAASCLLFIGWCFMLGLAPFENNRFPFVTIPYLSVMPFAGAIGAYLSRRMKGSVVERILAALFPVFTLWAIFAVRIVVFALFVEGKPYSMPHFLEGLSVTLQFTIANGLLLVLGAWPFCRTQLREQYP